MHATTRSLQRSLEEMTAANDSLREQLRELRGLEERLVGVAGLGPERLQSMLMGAGTCVQPQPEVAYAT